MIVLDTNVVSEMMKEQPAQSVFDWLASQQATTVYTTAITLAEILYGLECLPRGKRRSALENSTEIMFNRTLGGRILPFNDDAARLFALIVFHRERIGRPLTDADAQIASIARSIGASVATGNTRDFIDCGIKIVNPWAYSN